MGGVAPHSMLRDSDRQHFLLVVGGDRQYDDGQTGSFTSRSTGKRGLGAGWVRMEPPLNKAAVYVELPYGA